MDEGGVRAEDRKHFNKRQEVDDLEDDDEEEEYDDEDEEEDNVRLTTKFYYFQLGGFIVPDGELEEESQEGEISKRNENGKRHRKKKKPKRLDDDDFDLIQENTGKAVKRRKRLQKVSEKEAIDQAGADNVVVKRDSGEEDAQLFPKERRVVEEDDDHEMIDTTRKRYIPSANRNKAFESHSYVDHENVQKARNIFEDSAALGARVKQNKVAPKPSDKIDGADNLEGLYDADELDDQFATRFDREIQTTDIPERLQLKIGE